MFHRLYTSVIPRNPEKWVDKESCSTDMSPRHYLTPVVHPAAVHHDAGCRGGVPGVGYGRVGAGGAIPVPYQTPSRTHI